MQQLNLVWLRSSVREVLDRSRVQNAKSPKNKSRVAVAVLPANGLALKGPSENVWMVSFLITLYFYQIFSAFEQKFASSLRVCFSLVFWSHRSKFRPFPSTAMEQKK